MTRISTLGQQQSLITQMLKGQVQAAETQRQVAQEIRRRLMPGLTVIRRR